MPEQSATKGRSSRRTWAAPFLGAALVGLLFLPHTGCGQGDSGGSTGENSTASAVQSSAALAGDQTADALPAADTRPTADVLFVGNSHTQMHDLPGLVCRMLSHLDPTTHYRPQVLPVGFLEDLARMPDARQRVQRGDLKWVVLQAQKISASGKYDYSRQEAIDFATLARSHGAQVVFYPEWGLQGVPGDGDRNAAVYQAMAAECQAGVACVSQAWDMALAANPELELYDGDGNHQSPLGAFLTASVLAAELTGASPQGLADFQSKAGTPKLREILLDAAENACLAHRTIGKGG